MDKFTSDKWIYEDWFRNLAPAPFPKREGGASGALPPPATSTLSATGACAGLDFSRGRLHVMNGGEGINVVAMDGTAVQRLFVKLGDVHPGDTLEVCTLGRRCTQNIQVSVGNATYINIGRGTAGSVEVASYDVAAGRMQLTFHGVTLTQSNGDARCVLDGAMSTVGLAP